MSLVQDLDAVRARRGLPALPDPTRIQGFDGPSDAPSPQGDGLPPAIEHQPDAADEFGIHAEPPTEPAAPLSPLFPRPPAPSGKTALEVLAEQERALELQGGALARDLTLARAMERAQATLPHTRLALLDKLGEWKGRPVVLTEEEYQEVVEVVLRAMRRELDADLTEVLGRKPRARRRRAEKPAPEPAASTVAAAPAGRRSRRPRGSLLNRER